MSEQPKKSVIKTTLKIIAGITVVLAGVLAVFAKIGRNVKKSENSESEK
jgi:hypothetical protein